MILQKNLHPSRAGACLLIVLSLALSPLPAASDSHGQWDQERVTQLAVELAVSMRGLRTEVRRSIPADRVTTNVNRRRRLLDNLRLLQSETRFLAAELEAGQGFGETLPVAQRINRLVGRAVVDGRRLFLPKPVQQRINEANDLMDQLRPFYRDYANPEGLED